MNVPIREAFTGAPEYYSTLFHELTHSTGHEKRLGRRGSNVVRHFGDRDYSQEELVAEMGGVFLCGVAGIEASTLDGSAAYLDGWIRRLRGDAKLVVVAAAQAQKAADFILGNLATETETADAEAVAAEMTRTRTRSLARAGPSEPPGAEDPRRRASSESSF